MLSSVYYTKTNIFSFLEDFISESRYFQNFTKTLIRKKKIYKYIYIMAQNYIFICYFLNKAKTKHVKWVEIITSRKNQAAWILINRFTGMRPAHTVIQYCSSPILFTPSTSLV